MKSLISYAIFYVSLCGYAGLLNAYELATHGKLTYEAYQRSNLSADVDLLNKFGLEESANPFGEKYLDRGGNVVIKRDAPNEKFTADYISRTLDLGNDTFTIASWLMRGAIREDDHNELNVGVCHIEPPNLNIGDDDPHPSPPDRPIHHFYDPINDEGLFAGVSKKNPDWAIGAADAFAPALVEDTVRRNHFTVYDAMESMYRALTGRSSADGSTDIGPDNAIPPMTDEEIRKAYWATTFRALGDIVHLIEDVAQP